MTTEEYTCKDCKHYYTKEKYCTNTFYKEFEPDTPICDPEYFEKGTFNNRFYIKALPLGISTGYYYVLVDRENELLDYYKDYINFNYVDEAETICNFLNKQENRICELL